MLDFKSIESKWQKAWEKKKIFKSNENSKKKKFYCLEMFPYPSASYLHMGHVRNYTIGDVIARLKRMQGYNVLYPMGYDSFGLPAENAAKNQGIHPREYTEEAIEKIKDHQKALGNSYDWSRAISTHQPEYYRWNQYFFLKFLEKGLAYRKKAPVNWCPMCNSVLANEEVINGKCWRHEDTDVETRDLEQWFIKITQYADELLKGLDKLNWSERIKHLQRNWIGKSEGLVIDFKIKGSQNSLQVFTTRPDTVYGVTFLTVSPEHKFIKELAKHNEQELKELAKAAQDENEKMGVSLGSYATNPFTNEEVPIYAANFVIAGYGTGAVMSVPAHDKRDHEFAKKYGLKIKEVITPKDKNLKTEGAYTGEGVLLNSAQFTGLDSKQAIQKIIAYAEQRKIGKKTTQYKIRDWLISRQRYWGTPIPVIYCDTCGIVPEPKLPLLLPEKVDFKKQGNPLSSAKGWVEVKCPICGRQARRETDTMGGFVDSSWYFLRYCSPKSNREPFAKKSANYWMPVNQYIGGIEHAVGHLLYSRFWTKALRDMGMLEIDEPFTSLFNQGILYKDGHKMSKSFGNAVSQTSISDKYGIDTARIFLMSVASPESDMEWSDKGIEGSFGLLQEIWKIQELKPKRPNAKDEHKRNMAIKNYTVLLEEMKFNTAIIELARYADHLTKNPTKKGYDDLLKMISPFAPHTAEELWHKTGKKNFISTQRWPAADENKINLDFEQEDKLVESLMRDIRDVLKLAKIEHPNKITLITPDPWKYKLFSIAKEKLETTRNTSDIFKAVMGTELKKYGQDITKMLPKIIGKMPERILNPEEEHKALMRMAANLKEEFKCDVQVAKAQESKEQKAKQAMPGKPAIIVE